MATSAGSKSIFRLADGTNLAFTFVLVCSLFLLWGFCNGMIDVMDKHFQEELSLNKSQSAWVQFAHYLGYFLMSLPAGWLSSRLGYKIGIVSGLLIVALGGFWFIAATHINDLVHEGRVSSTTAFVAFLAGVCVIATGLTFLETIANPYTTVLGDQRYAATRINLAQSCNGIGWILGPIAGSLFFYSKNVHGVSTGNQTLYIPYAAVGAVVIVLAVVFYFANIPDIKAEDDYRFDDTVRGAAKSIWAHPHFVLAVAAQFLYVAAQAGIFSFFINYMTAQTPPLPASWTSGVLRSWFEPGKEGALVLSDKGAANLASFGFLCFLAGRFSGAAILRRFAAHKVLGLYGLINVLVCLLVVLKLGWPSVLCVFLSYFFMSIMFPTIFALGIHGLGHRAKKASAFIVMAIMGGAILPKLMGHVGDLYGMSRAFVVPLFCFGFVSFYGYAWPKLSRSKPAEASAPMAAGDDQ